MEHKRCEECGGGICPEHSVHCLDCDWKELCNRCLEKSHKGYKHNLFTELKIQKNESKVENDRFEYTSLGNDVFIGTLIDGIFNGTIKLNNGDQYDGEYKGYGKGGKGMMTYKNGDVYDGQWKEHIKEGKGKMRYSNGDEYDGEWKGDKKDGQGSMKYASKELTPHNDSKTLPVHVLTYEGGWKNDLYHGEGTLDMSNNVRYQGSWFKGTRHGQGKESYVFGDQEEGCYEGRWYLDKRHGCGLLSFPIGGQSVREYSEGVLIQSKPIEEGTSEIEKQKNIKESEVEMWKKRKALETEIALERQEMKLARKQNAKEIQEEKEEAERNKLKILSEIETAKKELESEKQKFEETKNLVRDLNPKSSDIIKINAGGTLFTTSITTLTKYDGLLKKMFSGEFKVEKMEDGSVFLDIPPEVFSFIISFLRNPVFYPPEDSKERERLRVFAELYGMKELSDYLTQYK
jgi:hypothetical protein